MTSDDVSSCALRTIRIQLLSSSKPSGEKYGLMLTAAGAGYSKWRDLAVTRWRGDATCDDDGSYLLLRGTDGAAWSATAQPLTAVADHEVVEFSEALARYVGRRGAITATMDVLVVPEAAGEVRRLTLHNDSQADVDIEATSYAEIVLAGAGRDAAHPAFSKLFVHTDFDTDTQSLLAMRRLRAADETPCWAAHLLTVEDGDCIGALQWETDRARFIGRDRTLRSCIALDTHHPLSGTVGTVLDPIFSLRRSVRIPAGESVTLTFWTVVAESREAVLQLARQCRATDAFDNATRMAQDDASRQLLTLDIDTAQARTSQQLASALLYLAAPPLRSSTAQILEGVGGAPNLWAGGISGDLPIALASISCEVGLAFARDLLKSHAYLSARNLHFDLVIHNMVDAADGDVLQAKLQQLVQPFLPIDGGKPAVFVVRDQGLGASTRAALLTAARLHLNDANGSLAGQLDVCAAEQIATDSPVAGEAINGQANPLQRPVLQFDNGVGGFSEDGRSFVTILRDGMSTPMPWTNVIANPSFGFIATAAGSGYTWSGNSQKNTLTPWRNDPVSDAPVDVIYVRDEDSGALWTPTALPIRDHGDYIAHHGMGFSRFEHRVDDIETELVQFVPVNDTLKISRLRLRNQSNTERHLSITAYVQWQLGANGADTAPYVVTQRDDSGAMLARNAWREDFGQRVAFFDLCGAQESITGSRTEFIGRNGALSAPSALQTTAPLSGRVGSAMDPCGTLQARLTLAPGAQADVVVLLGEGADTAEAQALIAKYRQIDLDATLDASTKMWNELLDVLQVQTPDPAFDMLLDHWLLYQVTACRLWARTAFYQASGAFGYRDQLQDVMALCVARPDLAREHILLAASRQFAEGDVQHWWLPPSGAGIRTRMTDDRLWLPYVACHYLTVSGDAAVLDMSVPFLQGEVLKPGQLDSYFRPDVSDESATLYEHCARAIDVSLHLGAHGLPLVGSGDWNDGMNRVGVQGRGESSWLGWFLVATIDALLPHAQSRGDDARMKRWSNTAASVRSALEDTAWDGAWYRRGYYDDGTPLGSNESAQCKIDTIAQSWSVIAGANDVAHAEQAMKAVEQQLIRKDDGVALLFSPPFDHPEEDPGYIAAYPPGVRENGGQYTHGAIWSIFAYAMQGHGDKAGALFELINPLRHADTSHALGRYKVEPYVACADVYSVDPHVGRGGWTWYTGSAAWLYRAGLEAMLGFRLQGAKLMMDPCIPGHWPAFTIRYRHGKSSYVIEVRNPAGVQRGIHSAWLDGTALATSPCVVPLQDDGQEHLVIIELGSATPAPASDPAI
jgi:cyclic beta-1,2-glucan synthetase